MSSLYRLCSCIYRSICIMSINKDIHHIQQPAYYWNDGVVILNESAKYLLGDICHLQSTDDESFQSFMNSKQTSYLSTLLTSKGNEIVVELHTIGNDIYLIFPLQQEANELDWHHLTASVAHEVKNPLTYIQLALHEIEKRATHIAQKSNGKLQAEMEYIRSEAQIAKEGTCRVHQSIQELQLCNSDITDVSNLRTMCEQSLRLCEYRMPEDTHIEIKIPKNLHFLGNKGHLSQVFMNLLINSSEANTNSSLRINIQASVIGEYIHIQYKDNCTGIPTEIQNQLFTPFTSTKGEQRGLGLYICKRLLGNNDGDIRYHPTPFGSHFELIIPKAQPKEQSISRVIPQTSRSYKSILVVDNEPQIRNHIHRLLSPYFDVTTASCGREAMGALNESQDYAIVLSDILMKDGSGIDIYTSLELQAKHLLPKLVYMTGATDHPDVQFFLRKIPNLVFYKPIKPDEFIQNLIDICSENKHQSKQLQNPWNGAIFTGFEKSALEIITVSDTELVVTGISEKFPLTKSKQYTVRMQNHQTIGEIATLIEFDDISRDRKTATITGMSARDRILFENWKKISLPLVV